MIPEPAPFDTWEAAAHWCCPPGTISGAFKEAAARERYREHQAQMGSLEALCSWHGTFHPMSDEYLESECEFENSTIRQVRDA